MKNTFKMFLLMPVLLCNVLVQARADLSDPRNADLVKPAMASVPVTPTGSQTAFPTLMRPGSYESIVWKFFCDDIVGRRFNAALVIAGEIITTFDAEDSQLQPTHQFARFVLPVVNDYVRPDVTDAERSAFVLRVQNAQMQIARGASAFA